MTLSIAVSDSIGTTDSPNINSRIVKRFVMKIKRGVVFHSHIG